MAIDAANLNELSTDDLKALLKAGEEALKQRDESTRKELWDKIKAQIEEAGHSVEQVFEWGMSKAKAVTKGTAPAKYRGPQGETWSGRGKPPRWLSALENAGHHRADFLIEKDAAAAPSDEPVETSDEVSTEVNERTGSDKIAEVASGRKPARKRKPPAA